MEVLKVYDYSNVFIASYFSDDRQCAHANKEHTLIYLRSGELDINDNGIRYTLNQGECAFMRRDHLMMLQKRVQPEVPYQSVVLKFSRKFLRDFYQTMDKSIIPTGSIREQKSLTILPIERPEIKSLFESILPFFDSPIEPSEALLQLKMIEGLYIDRKSVV